MEHLGLFPGRFPSKTSEFPAPQNVFFSAGSSCGPGPGGPGGPEGPGGQRRLQTTGTVTYARKTQRADLWEKGWISRRFNVI